MDVLGGVFRHGEKLLSAAEQQDVAGRVGLAYTSPGREKLGGNLELDARALGGEHVRDEQVGTYRGARILHRFHLRCAARDASRKVERVGEIGALEAMHRDAEA